ncbi:hypothetical protein NE579_16580, partial [Intestinimonas massiliensis]|nr:hypothetical protein [Intestinimonas massiliensis (ex Afouda et al. 2020)]
AQSGVAQAQKVRPCVAAGRIRASGRPEAEERPAGVRPGIPTEVAKRAKLMVVSYPNNPTTAMAPDAFYQET